MEYFRNRQRRISFTMVALLLGGWLSIVCQACMAHAYQDAGPPQQSQSGHCDNSAEHEPFVPTSDDTSGTCDSCDCASMVSSTNSKTPSEIFEYLDNKPAAMAVPVETVAVLQDRVSCFHCLGSPNLPRLSPVDKYNVQIK